MSFTGCVAPVGEVRMRTGFGLESRGRETAWENLGVDGSVIQSNPVITTSVYTPRIERQMVSGNNEFLTVNRNVILLGYNNSRL